MRLIMATAVCVLILYMVDAYFFNGTYFRAVEGIASQLRFSAK